MLALIIVSNTTNATNGSSIIEKLFFLHSKKNHVINISAPTIYNIPVMKSIFPTLNIFAILTFVLFIVTLTPRRCNAFYTMMYNFHFHQVVFVHRL